MPVDTDFNGVKICGVPDHLGDLTAKWPMLDVSIYADGSIGGVPFADAVAYAIKAWNDVCGLRLSHSTNQRTANIVVAQGLIDGRNGVLAQSELPVGFSPSFMRQLAQKYDTGEAWTLSANPPAGRIDLGRVMAHEIGHAIGIGHISDGNLMAPVYSTSIALPRNGDVTEARARYGAPAPSVPPPVNPPAGDVFRLQTPDGQTWEIPARRVS
jgi:predicted Zn-dependent protease